MLGSYVTLVGCLELFWKLQINNFIRLLKSMSFFLLLFFFWLFFVLCFIWIEIIEWKIVYFLTFKVYIWLLLVGSVIRWHNCHIHSIIIYFIQPPPTWNENQKDWMNFHSIEIIYSPNWNNHQIHYFFILFYPPFHFFYPNVSLIHRETTLRYS